jgi:hypothetical protein
MPAVFHVFANTPRHSDNEDVREQVRRSLDQVRHEIRVPQRGHDLCCVNGELCVCWWRFWLTDGKKSL